jgi:hypothetical protein
MGFSIGKERMWEKEKKKGMASHVDIKYSPKWIMILFYLIRMK